MCVWSPYRHTNIHYITFQTFHSIPFHSIPLHYTTSHYTPFPSLPFQSSPVQSIPLHYITLHRTAMHCIALHYITFHYITFHYVTLHYITLHDTTYVCVCAYVYVCVYIYIDIHIHIITYLHNNHLFRKSHSKQYINRVPSFALVELVWKNRSWPLYGEPCSRLLAQATLSTKNTKPEELGLRCMILLTSYHPLTASTESPHKAHMKCVQRSDHGSCGFCSKRGTLNPCILQNLYLSIETEQILNQNDPHVGVGIIPHTAAAERP